VDEGTIGPAEGGDTSPDLPAPPPAAAPGAAPAMPDVPPTRRPRRRRWLAVAAAVVVAAAVGLTRFVPDTRTGTLLSDSFDAPGGPWVLESTDSITTSIEGGVYRVQVRPKDDGFSSAAYVRNGHYAHVLVSVSARKEVATGPESLYGVDCWAGLHDEYRFEIDPDARRFAIVREQDGAALRLASGTIPGEALNAPGTMDRIQGECVQGSDGTQLLISLNGRLLDTQVDPKGLGSFRGVAVRVVSLGGMSDVVFDDVTLQSR
jgi:hypothetical protein